MQCERRLQATSHGEVTERTAVCVCLCLVALRRQMCEVNLVNEAPECSDQTLSSSPQARKSSSTNGTLRALAPALRQQCQATEKVGRLAKNPMAATSS